MAIDIDGIPLNEVHHNQSHEHDAIKEDKKRRIERAQTAQRVGTAKYQTEEVSQSYTKGKSSP